MKNVRFSNLLAFGCLCGGWFSLFTRAGHNTDIAYSFFFTAIVLALFGTLEK